jgi:hypothetical protein
MMRDRAVLVQRDVRVRRERIGERRGERLRRIETADAQRAGGDHETTHAEHLHEAATFHVGLCHDDFSAAALMAERMRG